MMPAMPASPAAAAAPPNAAEPRLACVRALAVACVLALIVLALAWELWLAPTGNRTLALKALPLALPLAGLLKYRLHTYRWVSLGLWLYFTEGAVRARGESGLVTLLALAEVALCLLLFAACVLHVRWRLGSVPAAAAS